MDARRAKISVFDHGFLYGDGVYETMRTYRGELLFLDIHLKRLRESLRIAKISWSFSDAEIIGMVSKLIRKNNFREARVRLMVTRGASKTRGAAFRADVSGQPTVVMTMYTLPFWKPDSIHVGRAVLFPLDRTFPKVKTTSLFSLVLARQYAIEHDSDDALLVNHEGKITEGAVSNFFIVKKGVIVTPPLSDGILPGTMREILVKIFKKSRLKFSEQSLFAKDIFSADEIFMTNAPRGISAVVSVDGKKIGNGKIGSLTAEIQEKFQEYILGKLSSR